MKEFKYSYDADNDDLFVYLEGGKSSGAVEMGNLILDFDKNEDLVAMQIINATEFFEKFISKIIKIMEIKSIKADIIKFRNMAGLKLEIKSEDESFESTILIPRMKSSSPALSC